MNHFFNKTTAFLLVIGLLLVISCTDEKDYYDPEFKTENPLENVDVPDGFDWKTTRSTNVKVEVADDFNGQYNYLIEVFDENPVITPTATLISRGVAKKGQPFITKITTPNSVENVFIRQTTPTGLASVRAESVASGSVVCHFGIANGASTRSSGIVTRATIEEPNITEDLFPTSVPGDATLVTGSWQNGGDKNNFKNFVIDSNTTKVEVGQYVSLYVKEDATITFNTIGQRHIYILPGKKLTIPGNFNFSATGGMISIGENAELVVEGNMDIANDVEIYNRGTMTISNIYKAVGTSITYNEGNISANTMLFHSGNTTLINNGGFECNNIEVTGRAKILNNGIAEVAGKTTIGSEDLWINNGTWTTQDMSTIATKAEYYNNCKLIVTGTLTLAQANFKNDGGAYIYATTLDMKNSRVEMWSGSYIHINEVAVFENNRSTSKHGFYGMGEKKSLLKTKKAITRNDSPHAIHYNGNLQIACDDHFEEKRGSNTLWTMGNGAEWASETNNTVAIPSTACNKGAEINPGTPEDKDPEPITDPFSYTYLFEDEWPLYGDYDMNDVVVTVNKITKVPNKEGKVASLSFDFNLRAVGASRSVAGALMLDGINATEVASVTYSSQQPGGFEILNSGLESKQDMAVIPLFSNAHAFLNRPSQQFINTVKNNSNNIEVTPTITVKVEFHTPIADNLDASNFNLFIIPNPLIGTLAAKERKEIHVAGYSPSKRANTTIFGDGNDNSTSNMYYVSKENLAWGIVIPEDFRWSVEFTNIRDAYTEFTEWIQSGGVENPEWWKKPEADKVF